MYGISKDVQVNESSYFGGGIHSGVSIEKISYESSSKDGNGKFVLAFHFKGKNGETFRHVEWPVDDTDASAQSKIDNMAKRIKHILTKFMSEEDVVVGNVGSFEEYAKAIIALAGSKFNGKTFAIKLVYNDKNKLGFTKYTGFIAKEEEAYKLRIGKDEKVSLPSASEASNPETTTATTDAF